MQIYEIGDLVTIIGSEPNTEGWNQCFAIGQTCIITYKYSYSLYEVQDKSGVRCTMSADNFTPVT